MRRAERTLRQTVEFYQSLVGTELDIDLDLPDAGLHVVGVGPFLILEMDPGKLDRIDQAKQTTVTVLAPQLEDAVRASVQRGAAIVEGPWQSPPGPGYRLRHPDGLGEDPPIVSILAAAAPVNAGQCVRSLRRVVG